MKIRLLEENDFHKGFIEVLNSFGKPKTDSSFNDFKTQFSKVVGNNNIVCVAESNGLIVGCGTIILEYKFHNGGCCCAHLEDIAVLPSERKKNVGSLIIKFLKTLAINNNCFKITLATSDDNINFYQKNGFAKRGAAVELFLT